MIEIHSVDSADFPAHDNLFQTSCWGQLKASRGQKVFSCIAVDDTGIPFPLLICMRIGSNGMKYAYIQKSPSIMVQESSYGSVMEAVALELRKILPADTSFVRFDLPWRSPYFPRTALPRIELQELRMNYGTQTNMLRKSPVDHLCPDTILIDLRFTPEQLLSRMRQTTRNCIRRAYRMNVHFVVDELTADNQDHFHQILHDWYNIYYETAVRKHFFYESFDYFETLFNTQIYQNLEDNTFDYCTSEILPVYAPVPRPRFYVCTAQKEGKILSGLVLGICGRNAYYLYSGSGNEMRDCMPNYGLQWNTILFARMQGCTKYDLLGIPPDGNPCHPMNGLYLFKTGFGGDHVRFCGCWDYLYDTDLYKNFILSEQVSVSLF